MTASERDWRFRILPDLPFERKDEKMINIKIIHDCIAIERNAESHKEIPIEAGTVAKYDGHLPGGNIAIMIEGQSLIVNAQATDCQ